MYYIEMNGHKNTYSLYEINSSIGEIIAQTKCEVKNVLKFIKLANERMCGENVVDILTGYEAGCLEFSLYHELTYHNISFVILPLILCMGSYKAVHVPTDDNEIKEYIALREDII